MARPVYYQCIKCCGPGNGSSEPGVCKRCKLVYWGLVHQCPPSALECSTCGKIFTSAYKLQFHLNQHNGLNPFKCRHCDFTSHSLVSLRYDHTNKGLCQGKLSERRRDELKYPLCKLCPELDRQNHFETCHAPELRLACQYCPYKSNSQVALEKHQFKYHRDKGCKMPKRQCTKCPQLLRLGSENKHYREHHDPKLPYTCDLCEFRAILPFSIDIHKGLWHDTGKAKIPCENNCGKQFTTLHYMQKHAKRYCEKINAEDKKALIEVEVAQGRLAREAERARKQSERASALKDLVKKAEDAEDIKAVVAAHFVADIDSGGVESKQKRPANFWNEKIQCPVCPVRTARILMKAH